MRLLNWGEDPAVSHSWDELQDVGLRQGKALKNYPVDGQGWPPHSWAVSPFRRDGFSHQSKDGPHGMGSAVYLQTSVSFLRVSFVYCLEGLVKRVHFNDD